MALKQLENVETVCCPKFNTELWNEKKIEFQDKLFLKVHVISFLYIPLNFRKEISRNIKNIEKVGAQIPPNEQLVMVDKKTAWGANIFIEVKRNIPKSNIKKISGSFITKVFEGPYGNINIYMEQMETYLQSKSEVLSNHYFFYTYCPKCANEYGKNYTVILAQVQST